jgi:hypothetical protein
MVDYSDRLKVLVDQVKKNRDMNPKNPQERVDLNRCLFEEYQKRLKGIIGVHGSEATEEHQ